MNFIRRRWKWIAALWLVSLLWWGVPRCFDSWQLEHRQAALLKAIEQRTPSVYADLVSTSYADDWNFQQEAIRKAMDDVAAQFLTLKISTESATWKQAGTEATWSADLTLSGKPVTEFGALILSASAKTKPTFSFVWRKEGWGAWTWKLVAVKNPELDVPSGYEPGSLSQVK